MVMLTSDSQLSTITQNSTNTTPTRSCGRETTSTSIKKRKKKERGMQELMDNATSKRSRTLSSIASQLPCIKTYGRRQEHCSVKPMLRCSSSVRQNDTVFESAESAIGKVGVDGRRSIGIQVDIGDEIVGNLFGAQNYVETCRCLALVKSDNSCIEFAGSLIILLPQQSMVWSNMATDVLDHTSSQPRTETWFFEHGHPFARAKCSSMLSNGDSLGTQWVVLLENASISASTLNRDPLPANIVGVHGKSKEGKTMGEENEDAKIGTRVEIKAEKKYISSLSLRKLRLLCEEKNQN